MNTTEGDPRRMTAPWKAGYADGFAGRQPDPSGWAVGLHQLYYQQGHEDGASNRYALLTLTGPAAGNQITRLQAETRYRDETGWHPKHDVYGGPHDEPPPETAEPTAAELAAAPDELAAPDGLAARFAAEAGIQVTTTTGGNVVLAPADAGVLLDLSQGFQPVPAGNERTCQRCGGGFQAGSRAWAIVWDGERYWLQVRYVITMPLGPYHTGCIGAAVNERNGHGQLIPPAQEPASLAEQIVFWLTGHGLTTRQLAQHTGRPEPEVLTALEEMEAGHLVRHIQFTRWVRWFPAVGQAPAATATEHDQRLDDGWATWEQVLDGGRHEHAAREGPFFAHRHSGGDTLHDHRPDDPLIPAVIRREYRRSREGTSL